MKKFLFTFFLILILAALAATAVIAEVWKPGENDHYQYPLPELVESVELKVGESYQIPDILLADNERIDHLEVSDPDILKLEERTVTALGQFFHSSVQVFTAESEVVKKQPRYEDVVIFGIDLTDALNSYHDWIRDFLHIEEHQPERTELRMLHIYEYDFEISGLSPTAVVSQTVSALQVGESTEVSFEMPENSFISGINIGDPSLVRVENLPSGSRFNALAAGQTKVSFFISCYKSLSEEQYAAYCAYQQAKGNTPASDRDKVEVLLRQIDCAITVTEKPQDDPEEPTGEKTYFTTSKGYQGYVLNGVTYIEGLLVVNKTYSLPSSYGKALTSQTQAAYNRMKQAAAKEGIKLSIVSGFRSYSYQVDLYNRYVKSEGKAQADSHSARPGHSEHQAGLAMDINSLSQSFDQTPEFAWLQANAWKYGFIMRYPKDSTAVTGYIYEPWHYRYVGEQWAEVFYNNGSWLTVEEYFGITSRYSD
jgi:D-alanyl-D-alanine carboxypeptidase